MELQPPLLTALAGRRASRTPLWWMRQAGRTLPEYRAIRRGRTLEEIVADPTLCAEVTLQPVRRFDLDAAVLFADIMLPLRALGVDFQLVEGVGPVVARPIRSASAVEALGTPERGGVATDVVDALRLTAAISHVPVICFCGGPFTLASYLVEGRPTRTFLVVRRFLREQPQAFDALLERLTDLSILYMEELAGAGAAAFQLFDSWAGALTRDQYSARVLLHSTRIFSAARRLGLPSIHFSTHSAPLLDLLAAAGPDAVSVDHTLTLAEAWERIGERAIQGNLDPQLLRDGPVESIQSAVAAVMASAGGRPGHVFNLSHGVLPDAPLPHLEALVDAVRSAAPAYRTG